VETQLITLSGIALQNLPRETGWHLRGTRRIGVSSEDVEKIQQCVEKVADYCGLVLDRIPRVEDIEHEVAFD
jgi:glutamate/tyrosine decarboxylase-like PLP-dependent enzyme